MKVLRNLLPFSEPPAERRAAEVRELLDTVSGLSAHEVVTQLTERVIPVIAEQKNFHMRFKLLEEALVEADKALPVVERHIDLSPLPLPVAATTSALAADNLMKALVAGYLKLAKTIFQGSQQESLIRIFQRATHRAMMLLARRQQLAYRSYAKPSESTWSMLHELCRMARALRAHLAKEEIAPIEHQYLSALLFAYLEPGKLPRGELVDAIFCTRQLAMHAMISDAAPDAGKRKAAAECFVVRPDEAGPGIPLLRLPPGTPLVDAIIIDCSGVLAELDRSLIRRPADDESDPEIPPGLLQALRQAIGGRAVRRFNRKAFKPHADLVGGIAHVIPFIEGDAHSRRAIDLVARRGARGFRSSEWALIDQSPDGFLVRFIQGENWKLGVGNVVALQARESSSVHVCLVRRVATTSQGGLELGLQVLSPQVSVVNLPCHGEIRRGIYLHRLPGYGNRPGIIARPGHLASGHKVKLDAFGDTRLWQIGRRLEASAGLEFFALVPL
ncbi:MAG TPA: hypothetical protein PK503_08100 [Azonexus sp.]|nr:hypothetical protein [Azonexus sp.]